MINIKQNKECCGCNACVQCCPKNCITMQTDKEGFLYPVVDAETCIDCGLCEKVCPVINQLDPQRPLKVYAAYNNNEDIRMQSSSGGIFTLLAEETIKKGGVVFGVKFNKDWMPEFAYAENIEGIVPFRGSKYVQAIVGNAYKNVEEFLKSGRDVLFCGTPCQIAGLKRYLRKEYDNLLTVDFICHGVPSPGVWKRYLEETIIGLYNKIKDSTETIGKENTYIENISFRNKSFGWKNFSFVLTLSALTKSGEKKTISLCQKFHENIFMKGFLADLYLRPSCYQCPTKNIKSGSDITIADFWKIEDVIPEIHDVEKGVSSLLLNTMKGLNYFEIIKTSVDFWESDLEYVCKYNKALYSSSVKPIKRIEFYDKILNNEIISTIEKITKRSLFSKIKNRIIRYLKIIKK